MIKERRMQILRSIGQGHHIFYNFMGLLGGLDPRNFIYMLFKIKYNYVPNFIKIGSY